MGPTVESLNLFLETKGSGTWGEAHDPRTISAFFTQMGALCPDLTDLTLGGQGIGVESIAIATQTIEQLRGLRTVYLSSNDQNDVTAILLKMAELPALESLHLDCVVDFPLQWPPSTITPFPKLRKLLIKWPSYPGTAGLIHNLAITASPLTDLELGEDFDGEVSNLKEMMSLAGEHPGLERIVMYSRADSTPLSIDTFKPILPCRALTILNVDHGGDVELTDDDFRTLASSLTKLKHLTLTSHGGASPSMTLRAISIAVALLPCLETLSIEVDARDRVRPEEYVHAAPHKHLRQLHLGNSPISHDPQVMAYLVAGLSDAEGFHFLHFQTHDIVEIL